MPSVKGMTSSILSRLGRDTQYVLVGFPLGLLAVVLCMTGFWLGVGLSLIWIGVPLLVGVLLLARGLATVERTRIAAVIGHRLPHPYYKRPAGSGFGAQVRAPLTDGQLWLDLLHGMFRFIPSTIAFCFTLTWWAGALGGLTFPLWDWSIPRGPDNTDLPELLGLGDATSTRTVFYLTVGLLFALTLYPVVRRAPLREAMLSPGHGSGGPDLTEHVAEEEAARDQAQAQAAAAVSAEAIALRRLERDIHDGPQQRLVRLAMDLGRAEQQFGTDPEAARATVAEALAQTRETLDELRALSRGIAPPILVDRGLSAALTALAGRCTGPVELDAPEMGRQDPAVESTAYFVVAEALTNVAKHSRATEAQVAVRPSGGGLLITVSDDGVGGASAAKGHGLAGLDERVRAAGGILDVDSAASRGTTIRAAIPL